MPKISDVYSGEYVRASELPVEPAPHVVALIASAVVEDVGRSAPSPKLVLDLRNRDGRAWPRRLVMNKTNSLILASAYGDDTDAWVNKTIELWSAPTTFDGKDTMGIKLAAVGNGSTDSTAIAMPTPARTAGGGGDLNDEIPF